MSFEWQNLMALALVVSAVGYLARRGWQTFARKGSSSCGGCGDCPSAAEASPVQIVAVDSLRQSAAVNGAADGQRRH
jgi:hypothetical protein